MPIELSLRLLIFIILVIVIFITTFLILTGMISLERVGKVAGDVCALIASKLAFLGIGAEAFKICEVFY
jgi:hypothetical protein